MYDINKFEELVQEGYLRKAEQSGLVIYSYTDKCTFDRHWNEYTREARGLILEKETGKVIAKCLPKFFNLGELEEAFITNLPNLPYTAFEKVDGSLGILFHYNDKWNVATRGSFTSDQAIKGAELLKKYDTSKLNPDVTYLTEIIYPENKIVVNYDGLEALIGLAAFNRETGVELNPAVTSIAFKTAGFPISKEYNYTIEQMIELQKTIPKDEEGFVVRFSNGFRVKIKGSEYMKISKILSHMSPLSCWEVMENGKVPISYLEQLPEEFRKEFDVIVNKLERLYQLTATKIYIEWLNIPQVIIDNPKDLGLFLQASTYEHKSAIWHIRNDKKEALDKYILKLIRPTGNIIST